LTTAGESERHLPLGAGSRPREALLLGEYGLEVIGDCLGQDLVGDKDRRTDSGGEVERVARTRVDLLGLAAGHHRDGGVERFVPQTVYDDPLDFPPASALGDEFVGCERGGQAERVTRRSKTNVKLPARQSSMR
jgi:hypothetical protein